MNPNHQLLECHIALFNQGVRTGDFSPLLAPFAPDATLTATLAGEMVITTHNGTIASLLVRYGLVGIPTE